jgi:cephalosporin hydroxylase
MEEIIKLRNLKIEDLTEKELEKILPTFGMNDEILNEMPYELNEFFGKGVKFWQYPNQFSKFLKFICDKEISSYLEIGTRWGGTFIIINEVILKKNKIFKSYACDTIPKPEILKKYSEYNNFNYIESSSQNINYLKQNLPNQIDFIFVDGDHTYEGVKNDYELALSLNPKYITFHDISNQVCPGVVTLWNQIKNNYKYYEFTDQYDSVNGSFLGIGVIEL